MQQRTLRMLFYYNTTRIINKYEQPNSKQTKKEEKYKKHCQIVKLNVNHMSNLKFVFS